MLLIEDQVLLVLLQLHRPVQIWQAPVSSWCTYYLLFLAEELLLVEALLAEVSLFQKWSQLLL